MKPLLLIALLGICGTLSAQTIANANHVIPSSVGSGTTIASGTLTATTAHNSLIVEGLYNGTDYSTAQISAVTAGACNVSWVIVPGSRATDSTGSNNMVTTWWCSDATAGNTGLTVTFNQSASGSIIWVSEVNCPDSCVVDDVQVLNDQGSSTTINGPSLTPTAAKEILFSHASPSGNITGLTGTGTSQGWTTSIVSGNASAYLELTSASGSYQCQWTGSSSHWAADGITIENGTPAVASVLYMLAKLSGIGFMIGVFHALRTGGSDVVLSLVYAFDSERSMAGSVRVS